MKIEIKDKHSYLTYPKPFIPGNQSNKICAILLKHRKTENTVDKMRDVPNKSIGFCSQTKRLNVDMVSISTTELR